VIKWVGALAFALVAALIPAMASEAAEPIVVSKTGVVRCIGDGTSGPRVQAIYAVPSDKTDRYAEIAPQIAVWAGQMNGAVEQSAAKTGGQRSIRFATNPDCTLNVARAVISPAGDDTLSNTINELKVQGYNRVDRKYVVWMDSAVYCGIGQVAGNDSPLPTNGANFGPHFARVDSGCWYRTDHVTALHELLHALGAVQRSAPNASSSSHCLEEYDIMCYRGSLTETLTYVCPQAENWLLDCGNNDYFHTNPEPGSYLATHWNVANSVFLEGSPSPSPSPTVTPSPTPTVSATPTPTPSPTKTNKGRRK
jgi:hypothetical protein